MIYSNLQRHFGAVSAEEILLEAMTLLGRLPFSQFMFHERDDFPRVTCPNSTVWFSYLGNDFEGLSETHGTETQGDGDIDGFDFTIELFDEDATIIEEFRENTLEVIARRIERHERVIRAKQTNQFALDQFGFDTGTRRPGYRLS